MEGVKRVHMRRLYRLREELRRFMVDVDRAYPGFADGQIENALCDRAETIRNAGSALAYLDAWIAVREVSKKDPHEGAKP